MYDIVEHINNFILNAYLFVLVSVLTKEYKVLSVVEVWVEKFRVFTT